MSEARPFVKWPGGKGQLLDRLEPLFPRQFNQYIEPFVGAGAVFFRLFNLGLIGANPTLAPHACHPQRPQRRIDERLSSRARSPR